MIARRAPDVFLAAAVLVGGVGLAHHEALLGPLREAPAAAAVSAEGTSPGQSGPRGRARAGSEDGGFGPTSTGRPAGASAPKEPWPPDYRPAFTAEDDAHRAALAEAPVAAIEKGSGGRSLAFRITLEDGTQGYYKPEQTFSGTNWHAEVASYHLDRMLGLGRVPPTVSRRLPWAPLRRAAGSDERTEEIIVQREGEVRGAFVWWIPEDIPPISPGAHWERWIRVAGAIDASPLVAGYQWRRELREGTAPRPGEKKPPPTDELPAQLSDMVLFDYLTHNLDRWGTSFTNVRTRGPRGPLIFLDNAAGFFRGKHRIGVMDARLSVVQKFRRRTVEAIRAFDLSRFRKRLSIEPLAPILSERLLQGLEVRRRHLLEHVARMERRFGDEVYAW
ncbi:MAG: hypothetical protein ACODAU_04765 [Myxococcota bacterium]